MFRIYDFVCNQENCVNKDVVKEIMVKDDESPTCLICKEVMIQQIPAPVGYVHGSRTPCNPYNKKV